MTRELDKINEKKVQDTSAETEQEESLEDVGDIRIADEVICIVASLAAQEVPGVVSMSGGLTNGINHFLGKENASKGVKLKFEGRTVNANVYINIEYGCSIPEIALEVQEKVKDAIEAMTGYDVQFVDVIVEGVAKRKATELEKGASSDETMADILRAQERNTNNSFERQLANLRDEHGFSLPSEEELDARHKKFFEED